jgi:membrane fusion protein (multidrug efflux system)
MVKPYISVSVLAFAVLLSACERGGQAPVKAGAMPQVSVVTIAPAPLTLSTQLPGRTAPLRIAEIRPQVNGLIKQRLFNEGAEVKAGEVLYQIDPAPFQAALDTAQAGLARAEPADIDQGEGGTSQGSVG